MASSRNQQPESSGRSTRQKRSIRQVLTNADRPLTPQEILIEAQLDCPGLGIATVYRAIRAWVEEGWIAPVELPGQPDRFELGGKRHHHHFHCEACDRVYPIHACPGHMENLAPQGFQVQRHDLTLHGRCAACATAS